MLSAVDNQVVTLSAKSPYFIKSGCSLRTTSSPRSDSKDSTTTSKPTSSSKKSPDEMDSTYFDQFLKTTTQSSASIFSSPFSTTDGTSTFSVDIFNFTEVDIEDFNATSPGYKTMVYDQEAQNNDLENTTDFRAYVEELMTDEHNRTKRQALPRLFESERKQTIYVSCHNAGGFTSVRPRWWYIALANCGSTKGLDVRYKFRMTNGALGDFWHEHFSADEMCK